MRVYRQGDVLIVRSSIPADAAPAQPTARGYVLAEGEATGHAHTIEATPNVQALCLADALFLRVSAPVKVWHQEHAPILLPEGDYQVVRQV